MPGRASPLHALPGAADTEAWPGHLPSSKPRGPLRMGLCLSPLLHPKSRSGTGCWSCAGGAKPRLNRLSLSHRKSGQQSGTRERRHPRGRPGRWQVPTKLKSVNLHSGDLPQSPKQQPWPPKSPSGVWVWCNSERFPATPRFRRGRKDRGRVFSAGRCKVSCFCIPHQAAAPSFKFFSFFFFAKPPPEHSIPREALAAAVFSGLPSSLKTLWVSFSKLSSCCCHAGGRRKLGPYSGASNLPLSRGWEPQCTRDPDDPGVLSLAAAGFCQREAGSCRVAGIGFQCG